MATLTNLIIIWVVVTFLVTLIIYATVKIFLIVFRYNKEQRKQKEKIEEILEKGS